jgi:hypothetical protein
MTFLSFTKRLQKFQASNYFIPLALLFISFITYGVFSPFLGFFGDEWQMVYEYMTRQSAGVAEYFFYDGHPLSTWSYLISFNLFGNNPFAWQAYSFLLRWFSCVSFWMVLNLIWPKHRIETFMAASVFMLYPQFYMQAEAVAYFEIWLNYCFLWLSFYFSILAVQKPQNFLKFFLFALLLKAAHLFSSEYTWGTELLRPFFLWLALSGSQNWRSRLASTAKISSIFIVIFLAIVVWRGVIFESPAEYRSTPYFIEHLFEKPARTLRVFGLKVLPDLALLLISSWNKLIQPDMFNFERPLNILIILIIVFSILLSWYLLSNMRGNESTEYQPVMFLVGIAGLFLGMLPFYASGRFLLLNAEPWNGRYALGSMPGIALITVSTISYFIKNTERKVIFFALLSGLLIGWQFRGENMFRKIWMEQRWFYQQLLWRAPDIKPGTAIFATGNALPLMHDLGTTYAINTIYNRPPTDKGDIAYWFISAKDEASLAPKTLLKKYYNSFLFKPKNIIMISYSPDENRCMWVLSPEMQSLSTSLIDPLPINGESAYKRISPDSFDDSVFKQIFGSMPPENWCYYFQKADLAAQQKDWKTVILLWDEAKMKMLEPSNGIEYLPFVRASLSMDDWQTAFQLTRLANKRTEGIDFAFCHVWKSIPPVRINSQEKKQMVSNAITILGCKSQP